MTDKVWQNDTLKKVIYSGTTLSFVRLAIHPSHLAYFISKRGKNKPLVHVLSMYRRKMHKHQEDAILWGQKPRNSQPLFSLLRLQKIPSKLSSSLDRWFPPQSLTVSIPFLSITAFQPWHSFSCLLSNSKCKGRKAKRWQKWAHNHHILFSLSPICSCISLLKVSAHKKYFLFYVFIFAINEFVFDYPLALLSRI